MNCTQFPNSCPFPSTCFVLNNTSSCGCLTSYVFKGYPNCDKLSELNILMISYYSVTFTLILIILLYAAYSSKDYILELISKKRKVTDLTYVALIATVALIILLAYHGLLIVLWINPLLVGAAEVNVEHQRYRTSLYRLQKLILILIVFNIMVFDCLIISATWYLLARDIKKLQTSKRNRIRLGSFIISICGFIIFIGLFVKGGIVHIYAYYFISAIAVLIIFILLKGSYSLHNEISKSVKDGISKNHQIVLKWIMYAAVSAAFGATIALIGNILVTNSQNVTFVYYGYDVFNPIDRAGPILFSSGLIWTLTTLLMYGVIQFRNAKLIVSSKKSIALNKVINENEVVPEN